MEKIWEGGSKEKKLLNFNVSSQQVRFPFAHRSSPICPGSCRPRKRMQTVMLKQFMLWRPSWHCDTVMLMEAGRKMETSTVMTGRVLQQDGRIQKHSVDKTGL